MQSELTVAVAAATVAGAMTGVKVSDRNTDAVYRHLFVDTAQ